MKVLGTTTVGEGYATKPAYIVVVTEYELQLVANKAGYREEIPKLKPGDDYPLAEGYNFRADIRKAVDDMTTAYSSFQKASQTMTSFAALISERDKKEDQPCAP